MEKNEKIKYLETMIADCDWNLDYHSKKWGEFVFQRDLYVKELKELQGDD